MEKICSNCKYWERIPDTTHSVDMGNCSKLSGITITYPPEYKFPDVNITGIESTPFCMHDGIGFTYETKSWFGCIHFNENK